MTTASVTQAAEQIVDINLIAGAAKTKLDEIEKDDFVAFRQAGGGFRGNRNLLIRRKVARTTKTQIILECGTKFNRSYGEEIGADTYRRDQIWPLGGKMHYNSQYTANETVELEAANRAIELKHRDLVRKVEEAVKEHRFEYMSAEKLEMVLAAITWQPAEPVVAEA